ncbi:hypothetical protein GJ744_006319 [Endocarpon pusillum]|uniref:Uncharacterized protein n=1 Tax=Endocarpon pusillum TaxID=364733 RepID=A0A8H7AJW6_9EURO|nr:hypothetical protein GJ744_006319 [Endocarpon pusillum]
MHLWNARSSTSPAKKKDHRQPALHDGLRCGMVAGDFEVVADGVMSLPTSGNSRKV